MNKSNKLLSDIVSFRTYAKHLKHLGRREMLEETINRNMQMHLDRFPKLSRDIIKAYKSVHDLKLAPSMRALQFSGEAVLKNNCRQFNCSFRQVNDVRAFGEILFLLLSGTGVGFSVQRRHVNQLPKVTRPREAGLFCVHDSIQGWAQALDVLCEAYFYGRIKPQFDFFQVRPKGSYLVTTGAKAPGPEPLKKMLEEVEKRLEVAVGRNLTPLEVHDIVCLTADCVLAGGIRRAATISLFDRDDKEMLSCKNGQWWEKHPYRARANNSAVLPRSEVTQEEFNYIYSFTQNSNSGEPGFFWTNNPDIGCNPCAEISLYNKQFCNLTTVNQTTITSDKDFFDRIYSATLIGTLQAAYTDFPYLTDDWKKVTEGEALIGVSFTGVADVAHRITNELLFKGANLVKEVNEKYAHKIGINPAARCTTLKPEGSSSTVFGSSSGIHARHDEHYLRRIRMNKDDALAVYLQSVVPELVEPEFGSSTGVVVTIPQEAPAGAIIRSNESAIELFDRVVNYNLNWVQPGHRSGENFNNVSATISVKENEWVPLRDAMWENRTSYTGISLLPFDGGVYQQAPFESCDKVTYEKYMSLVKDIDLRNVKEEEDNTVRTESIACSGGACDLV